METIITNVFTGLFTGGMTCAIALTIVEYIQKKRKHAGKLQYPDILGVYVLGGFFYKKILIRVRKFLFH